ncbi:hypothetical protein CYR55_05650 [Chimaeribacter californicus]|uniref:Uncharacterized protein n=1 Tax=Chimaeribacter californicus TaxID=2060067 RepID=A0A2N5EE09_9GAMM|nr:hypothetical protein CYR55_05650 [Chimaeribacter californicus]
MSVYFYSGLIYKSGIVVRGFSGIIEGGSAGEAYRTAQQLQVDVLRDSGIYSDDYLILVNQFNKVE